MRCTEDELKRKISNKFVLLDTGIIIRAFEHFEDFKGFFNLLETTNCHPVYFPFIEFEFLRGAYEPEHRSARREFLHTIPLDELPVPREEILDDAIRLANIYSNHKLHSAKLVDCCIAAYLMKHTSNLFLVTLNHKDFPTFVFDRIFIYPVDTDNEVFPIGFYQLNVEKTENELKKLSY